MSGDYLSRDEMLIAITDNSNKLNLNFMPQHDINIFVEFLEDFPAATVAHGDLISRSALIERIEKYACEPCKKEKRDYNGVMCRACQYGDEIDDIENAPAVDAALRVHGKWDKIKHCTVTLYKCSACGGQQRAVSDYCPHCGAIMDLKGE